MLPIEYLAKGMSPGPASAVFEMMVPPNDSLSFLPNRKALQGTQQPMKQQAGPRDTHSASLRVSPY